MKRFILISAILLSSVGALAQDAAQPRSFWNDPFNDPMLPLYVVIAFIFVTAILVSIVALLMIRVLNMLTADAEKARAAKLGIAYVPRPSWWARFSQKMNASVPVEQEKNIELDHNYDGIKELDNHLPPWWKWLFYGTIGWSAVYLIAYHVSSSLPLSIDEYQIEVAVAEDAARKRQLAQPIQEIDESSLAFSADSAGFIANGKNVFNDNNCGSCHRNDGGGNTIGPNLTDAYWLHGGHIRNVFATIKNGVVEKGMPAWGKALTPQQVRDVTFFVMSLQGTNPANAKAPQGEMFTQQEAKSDSTKTAAL